jgi:hypothetical protein
MQLLYTALSDNMVGHLWANMLLVTHSIIKVIPLYIRFCDNYLSEIPFYLQLCSIHVSIACQFLLLDVALFM